MKTNIFELFRYQILPVDRYFQGDLFSYKTLEDLISHKNKIFFDVLNSVREFSNGRHIVVTRKVYQDNDFVLLRIAHNRLLHRETVDFGDEVIDSWPDILVAIWNDPDKQMVAIQKRVKAFSDSNIPARLIFDKVNSGLVRKGLRVIYEPMFKKEVFWSYIEKYSDRVKLVDFELVTPNMANISGVLPNDLKNFAKEANATKTNLKLESDPESHLKLDSDNKTLSGLVDYSSEGGGNISVKISGMKRRLQTAKSVREIELADIEVEGNPEDVTRLLKDLMK